MTIRPVIIKALPERKIRWMGHLFVRGLFDGEYMFEIRPPRGITPLCPARIFFSGPLRLLLGNPRKNGTAGGFDEMNRALKFRTDQMAGTGS
ncbi:MULTISPECIES: hypothetical protein [unclassified Methanoregula]|uniref:hypothetical protein n=1 Tax=unclassified Methanoregula TaxID=2649730 RepID=UPI0009CA2AB4|nr:MULTISPECIES: hypothetical protein [unclassified Methanoregula]OPX61787.1 MAG: hypothetical protein A4E33_02889 [Methanoregula sp. PtaB.Bin085]OPY33904.1 MAG: hypothetical protein A4E34_01489 [Methanoregula sp. PtaU1.Bin006]